MKFVPGVTDWVAFVQSFADALHLSWCACDHCHDDTLVFQHELCGVCPVYEDCPSGGEMRSPSDLVQEGQGQ